MDRPNFRIVLTGYERTQVEAWLSRIRESGPEVRRVARPSFTIVLRGYDRRQVDAYLDRVDAAASAVVGRPPSLTPPKFTTVQFGYESREVDNFVALALDRIAELERQLEQRSDTGD